MTEAKRQAAGSGGGRRGDRLLTVDELAALCKVPKATCYKWRQTGEGPKGMRLGKHLRYWESDVMAWLQSREDDWQPDPPKR